MVKEDGIKNIYPLLEAAVNQNSLTPELVDYMLENAISINKDLFDRPTNFSLDSLDSLPKYIRDNQKKYEKYLKL